jgi:5'-nucleotidase
VSQSRTAAFGGPRGTHLEGLTFEPPVSSGVTGVGTVSASVEPGSTIPKAVLFDMDDTIVDHALTSQEALGRVRRASPILLRRPRDELWNEYSRLLENGYRQVVRGAISRERARVERFHAIARYCGSDISESEALAWAEQYREAYHDLRRLVPGSRRLLERLHGRAVIGVVTNSQVAEQEEKVEHFGLKGLIDFLVVSEGVGVSKPDPRIFSTALDLAAVEPGDSVMIGDSWENDVRGARSAGIPAIWFNRFGRSAPEPIPIPQLSSFRAPRQVERLLARIRRT